MSSGALCRLCDKCSQMTRSWQKHTRMNTQERRPTSLNILEMEISIANGCILCTMIVGIIPQEKIDFLASDQSTHLFRVLFTENYNDRTCYALRVDCGDGYMYIYLSIIPDTDGRLSLSTLESISPRTDSVASLSTVEKWIRKCSDEHRCHSEVSMQERNRILPTRLIFIPQAQPHDFQQTSSEEISPSQISMAPRLVLTKDLHPEPIEYTTLSHCWGTIKQFTLTKENMNSLLQSIPVEKLCRTFQDAMFLTRRLGYQYLWIDSLCIIQDNPNDWRHESSMMATVYGGTSLNFAASHAANGNGGCFVDRNPAHIVPCRISTGEGKYKRYFACMSSALYMHAVAGAPLSGRAWAFQERFLAPRTLHFTQSQLFWECQQLDACETFPEYIPPALLKSETVLTHNDLSAVRHKRNWGDENNPSAWSDVVLHYSSGLLTHPEDKLVAISGVARKVQSLRQDEYLAGLWRKDIEWQLLWSVNSDHEERGTSGIAATRPASYRAPSWSWASVDGIARQLFPYLGVGGIYHRNLLIKVISGSVKPLFEDPFGELSHGQLRIMCDQLVPVPFDGNAQRIGLEMDLNSVIAGEASIPAIGFNRSYPDTWNPDFKSENHVAIEGRLVTGEPIKPEYSLQLKWDSSEHRAVEVFYFLPVWYMSEGKLASRSGDLYWGGLLLTPTGNNRGEYKRVARVDCDGANFFSTGPFYDRDWLSITSATQAYEATKTSFYEQVVPTNIASNGYLSEAKCLISLV